MQSLNKDSACDPCRFHNKNIEYIDLNLNNSNNIYKCIDCVQETKTSKLSKAFIDQSQIKSYNIKDIFLINDIISMININSIKSLSSQGQSSKQGLKGSSQIQVQGQKEIQQQQQIQNKSKDKNKDNNNDENENKEQEELGRQNEEQKNKEIIIKQLQEQDNNIDIRQIKNILFQSQYKNQIIQRHTFNQNMNLTSNIIQFYNKFLIFGCNLGFLQLYSISLNKVILQKQISQQGIVVIIKDPKRIDYFFASGYDGNIVECQIKSSLVDSSININNGSSQSQSIQSEQQQQEDEKNIYIKMRRKFINNKQVCRMIFCNNGSHLAVGLGKKISIWNIKTGRVQQRLTGYHSAQVYGLETMNNGSQILSISKGFIHLFDLKKFSDPLVFTYKFQQNHLLTRIKKINENEFVVFLFPKGVAFFRIFQEKSYTFEYQNNNNNSVDNVGKQIIDESYLLQQQNQIQQQLQQQSLQNQQQKQSNLSTKPTENLQQQQQQQQQKKQNNQMKTVQESKIKYNILKIGELRFEPYIAYNMNIFDNYMMNICGDYPFSFLLNYQNYKGLRNKINFQQILYKNLYNIPSLDILTYNGERVLSSILLENITINNQYYHHVIVNIPRNNQQEPEDEEFHPSINLSLYA